MRSRAWRRAGIVAGLVLGTACGSETGPDPLANGSMSARIDGGSWSAAVAVAATYSGGILAVAGTDGNQRTIGFAVLVNAPGTLSFASSIGANASLQIGTNVWQAAGSIGSGTITVTALTATGARGTFQFALTPAPSSGATGNRAVTEGSFDVTF